MEPQNMTPILYDLNSADGVRKIVIALLQGYNYRLFTEGQTRTHLLVNYEKLSNILKGLTGDPGSSEWTTSLMNELDEQESDLAWWLLGLTTKTAKNLGLNRESRKEALEEIIQHIISHTKDSSMDFSEAVLMLWGGAATLSVRGSRKSTAGKTLERAFLRTVLTILGLQEEKDFWLNIPRDVEVSREVDAELASKRGRIRIEIGLIEAGNQEVIEDKIARVGSGGIVIFDRIGTKSKIQETADNSQVKLIQIRNNRPLTELFLTLSDRVTTTLQEPPSTTKAIASAVNQMDDYYFFSKS